MRIFICDDETVIRDIYQEMIEDVLKKKDITANITQFASVNQIIISMDEYRASDILFLDINMPDVDGIEGSKLLRKSGYVGEIIFLTKSRDDWKEAFDVDAMNYLIKPDCDEKVLEKVIMRAVERIKLKNEEMVWFTSGYDGRHIYLSTIYYFEVKNRIIIVHYGDNEQFEFYSQMGTIENRMISKGFCRVHRAFLISIENIDCVNSDEVTMKNGDKIPLGRSYKKSFKERLAAVNTIKI